MVQKVRKPPKSCPLDLPPESNTNHMQAKARPHICKAGLFTFHRPAILHLHINDHGIAKSRAGNLGRSLHQALEIISNRFRLDRTFHAFDN